MPPSFEERNSWTTSAGYKMTNEEPEVFTKILGRRRFQRAAAIASGGEIPLLVMLPVCEEVIAIDHSYMSLAAFYQKAVMMEKIGGARFKAHLIAEKYEDLNKVGLEVWGGMPEPLTKNGGYGRLHLDHSFSQLRREWAYVSMAQCQRASALTDKVKLVHGDLTDLSHYGTFDLLYVSNAMEHTGRLKRPLGFQDFLPLLNDGGHLMMTGAIYNGPGYGVESKRLPPELELVETTKGFRGSHWLHHLMRKVTPVATETQPTTEVHIGV